MVWHVIEEQYGKKKKLPGSRLVGPLHPLKVTLKVGLLDLANIGTGTTMTIVM